MPLASALCHIHDSVRLWTLCESVAPLRSLAPVLDVLIGFCVLSHDRATGREIGDRHLGQVERLLGANEVH